MNVLIYSLIVRVQGHSIFRLRSFSSRFVLKFVHVRKITVLSLVSLNIFPQKREKNHHNSKCITGSVEWYFNAICNSCLICPLQFQDQQVVPCPTSARTLLFTMVVDCERSKNFNPALLDFSFNLMQEQRLAKKKTLRAPD